MMGPHWQQQRQQQEQRQQQQRQQQLLREQMERMRKQQETWREQQQKGYAWQQQENHKHYYGLPKGRRTQINGKSPSFQLNPNLVKTPNKSPVKKGGFTQVAGVVIALVVIVLAIYGVLWLLSTF